ncbi:anthranilate synthase component 2 [Clostridium acidisoli DSM 12555]|uniref:Anthranilate synthase component 2 n=1 Tax=Clostridium acidisoli DSM 12555 TaxID=1121291 RepID=A0A1W1XMK0_9CLOT|nr:aminodeoxychorismate/anthranilate synthase component II [Clostridium acidisoli]SMC25065.1 anthranilate synthase component 2 [Clostridium acidisoli DSM 12555]
MILLIDNYDSFTYNLYQYVGEIYEDILVKRNDEITLEEIKNLKPEGIIISPGPGIPEKAGICIEVIKKFAGSVPILGICLGHQAIGYAYGANVVRAKKIMHGKTSRIKHDEIGIFKGIKSPLEVMRYHSLILDTKNFPNELSITAKSQDDDVIMAVKHKIYEVYGLQFHPESIKTEFGRTMIRNFVEGICNVKSGNKKIS